MPDTFKPNHISLYFILVWSFTLSFVGSLSMWQVAMTGGGQEDPV